MSPFLSNLEKQALDRKNTMWKDMNIFILPDVFLFILTDRGLYRQTDNGDVDRQMTAQTTDCLLENPHFFLGENRENQTLEQLYLTVITVAIFKKLSQICSKFGIWVWISGHLDT